MVKVGDKIEQGEIIGTVGSTGRSTGIILDFRELTGFKRIRLNPIGKARAINSDLNYFKDKFIMPVKGIISGVYGSQRI